MPDTGRQRLSSQKTSNKTDEEQWHCQICKVVASDDKAEMLECEYCDEHFCKKCLNLSSAEYKILTKRSDIHWYCPPCEAKALKNLKIEKDVETRCKEYFQKIESRLSSVEREVKEKPSKDEVQKMIEDSKISGAEGTSTKVLEENLQAVEEKIADMRESEARRENVIIYGLPEATSDDSETRKEEDHNLITELCESLDLDKNTVKLNVRLGKIHDKNEKEARPRPVKVKFNSSGDKSGFLKSLNKLPKAHKKFSKISVVHDMTPNEREENRLRVQEAKEKNGLEASGDHKHIVVGRPWDRKVIRVKKRKS